jgi:hypothetical protein
MLKTLLPMTLPRAMSEVLWKAAMSVVLSSGNDVPKATTLQPTEACVTPKLCATATDPSTVRCAPNGSMMQPRAISKAIDAG